jgi:choline dehydrogenase-like flavoprotein
VATLDFESADSDVNRLKLDRAGGARLHWGLNLVDEVNFESLLEQAIDLLMQLRDRFGASMEPLGDFSSLPARRQYLHGHAIDAFHLGGGIPFENVLDHKLRLRTARNVFVVSGAVFQRPGLANPTLTLLALAHRCADALHALVAKG